MNSSDYNYWNHNDTSSSDLFRVPTVLKEMSRLVDLFGKLDVYKYSKKADIKALNRDYALAYENIRRTLEAYEQEQEKKISAGTHS